MPAKKPDSKYLTNTAKLLTYPESLLDKPPWQEFLHHNGYPKIAQTLKLKVFTDIEDSQVLWQMFSPNVSVFDLWDVRFSFYQGYKFTPYFLTIFRQKQNQTDILGVLPLWLTKPDDNRIPDCPAGKYVWFGSNWPEDNVFFTKDPEIIPLLLAASPKPLDLLCLNPKNEYNFLLSFPGFAREKEKKFFLDLKDIHSLDDFLGRLKKKKRYNLRRDRKHILALNPTIKVDNYSHLEEMFKLSIERFKEKYPDDQNEQSAFADSRRQTVYRSLVENAGDYKVRLITTIINGKIEAVEFGLIYNRTFYAFNAGVDVSHFSGLGVFSNLLVIEDAIKSGCTKIDFLEGDNNWKESWNLDFIYPYQFVK